MTMIEWDSRLRDDHSVQILKTVIPFFDVAVGERIDMEGLLSAVRPFTRGRERHILDVILQFFQMQRMMEMMQLVQSMQQMQQFTGAAEGEDQEGSGASPAMFEMLKAMIPPEQQGMADMISAMMAMSEPPETGQAPEEDIGHAQEEKGDSDIGIMQEAENGFVMPEDKQKEGDHEPVDL